MSQEQAISIWLLCGVIYFIARQFKRRSKNKLSDLENAVSLMISVFWGPFLLAAPILVWSVSKLNCKQKNIYTGTGE